MSIFKKKGDRDKLINASNKEFVELCYEKFLNRPCDFQGRENYIEQLNNGYSRIDLIKSLVSSPEYYTLISRELFGERKLSNLTKIRSSSYSSESINDTQKNYLTFQARSPEDFDWLENKILSEGFYESVGVWSLAIDNDKKLFSEIIERFKPDSFLEIGCSTGSILKLLTEKSINAEGVEISHLQIALSYSEIKNRIHYGDILDLNLKKYDFILGLDIFEHLNPNKLPEYVKKCYSLLNDNGYLLTNIPAYGNDPVFGEIFPLHLLKWQESAKKNELFNLIPTDNKGWPENGHISLATSRWWTELFMNSGFKREIKIEEAIHQIYDPYWDENTPGRKSIFVFSKNHITKSINDICHNILKNQTNYAKLKY